MTSFHELIPYIVTSLLFVTTTIAVGSRRRQFFSSGYLLANFYDRNSSISYEQGYAQYRRARGHQNRPLSFVREVARLLLHPLSILTLMSLLISVHFGQPYVKKLLTGSDIVSVVLYIGGLTLIYVLTIAMIATRKNA